MSFICKRWLPSFPSLLSLVFALGCASTSTPINPETLTFETIDTTIKLPAAARVGVYMTPGELNKEYTVSNAFNRWVLPEGKCIQTAAIKVFGRVFTEVLASESVKAPHLVFKVSGISYVNVVWARYSVDASAVVNFGNGEYVGSFSAKGESSSGMVNDPHALENAYVIAFQSMANQIIKCPRVRDCLMNGFDDSLVSRVSAGESSSNAQTDVHVSASPAASKYEPFFDSIICVRTNTGVGSGFFVDSNGFALTCAHVVAGDYHPAVTLHDGRTLLAEVIAADEELDIALIKTNVASSSWLPIESDPMSPVGTEVIAIGAPFSLDYSLSKGVISAHRMSGSVSYIQTDAALNPGNSGGPIISLITGRVVGMVTSAVPKDISEGLNFAISGPVLEQYIHRNISIMSTK